MTPDPNLTKTTPLNPDRIWPNRHQGLAHERLGELAETCRVLTELAQQLVDALAAQTTNSDYNPGRIPVVLAAAAELGITPTQQP